MGLPFFLVWCPGLVYSLPGLFLLCEFLFFHFFFKLY
nr:MAG TPA: hypothetical protein [Caudoviricetes sp.]